MKTPALALIAALAAAPAMAQGQPTYLPLKTPEVPVPVSDAAARANRPKISVKKIILVGDSTMQVNSGWGGAFCARHVASTVTCVDLGRGGRSTLSYRAEGSWDIALAEARLAAAEAALAKAQADAELSRVRAPFAGTILRIIARPGDQVGSDGLLEIGDLTRMDVVADVYETDLPRLRVGAPAEIVVPGESRRFAATVREVGWTVRRQTQANTDPVAAVDARTVEVRLALDEAGAEALRRRSNMQVQVAIRP